MKKYTIILLSVIVGVGVFHIPKVQALSCISRTPAEHVESADAIFLGTVTTVEPVKSADETTLYIGKITFNVSKYWKGEITNTITIGASLKAWGSTEDYFKVGNTYIVYAQNEIPNFTAKKAIEGYLYAGIDCSSTHVVLNSQPELPVVSVLGDGKIPSSRQVQSVAVLRGIQKNLTLGSSGSDVIILQNFLESNGYLVMPHGIAKGYFGVVTRKSLAAWQAKVNIKPALGNFGPITRAYISITP